ncbi:uncharacterized protein LOC108909790 [Anoplophora glabripennis]|uniref:uncharacterized protein LOC108909790 n=1 Tax=Anoplophora glabripennis TaxID=217634 RepID=UPI00087511B8|nr:uncharacterized protein LOC108909790 [Anoplophora glabripennis]
MTLSPRCNTPEALVMHPSTVAAGGCIVLGDKVVSLQIFAMLRCLHNESARLYREPKKHEKISLCETCLNVTATMAAIIQVKIIPYTQVQPTIGNNTYLLLVINYLSCTVQSYNVHKQELVQSESKDGKLEIIKRIKKINDDGSYTIGYEADDGSFKIESRDVLGQIKGTYGFVDEEGQIKRVSYSTSNSSELITRPEPSSVVQRIPNKNKTTTRIPVTTQSTPTTTSNSVIQSIARRRASIATSTTTQRPNYNDVINVAARTTNRSSPITYTSAPPRVLVQSRTPITSTVATQTHTAKSEGQLIRPETVTQKPTELPLFRRLAFKQLEDDKPVTEEPESEGTGNILRRQLSQENTRDYNVQEHLYSLQQSLGHDTTDVYSSSMTTGTPRPLFTTTNRPRIVAIPSPSTTSLNVPRPTIRYPLNYQRNVLQDLERNSPDYSHETTTNQPVSVPSTQSPTSADQIPPNKADQQELLVAIKHPFQRGTILVPLSQLQGRLVPIENMRDINEPQKQYTSQQESFFRETATRPNIIEIEQQQAVVRRLPPPPLRPIPVQVDENGFIREIPRQVQTYPVPLPVPVMPMPKHVNKEIDNDIDNIEPPVSTRDFQKLLQQLIVRQSRLEKISALTRQRELYLQDQQQQQQQQRYRTVYSETPEQYYVRREPTQSNGPVQFIQRRPEDDSQRLTTQQFFEHKAVPVRSQQIYENHYDQQSYRPNRRVARLLPSKSQQKQQELQEEYLPPDVREMLLLRMLQLAINPALPLDDDKFDLPTAATQVKRMPVRNVEILGEEEPEEPRRRPERSKRYREFERDYE